MFIISQSNTYKWPITVEFPIDGGNFEKQTFDAEFRRMTQSQIESWLKKISDGEAKDADFAAHVLVGWSGITDGNAEVAFSEYNRNKLFDIPLVTAALIRAYISSVAGAKAKN